MTPFVHARVSTIRGTTLRRKTGVVHGAYNHKVPPPNLTQHKLLFSVHRIYFPVSRSFACVFQFKAKIHQKNDHPIHKLARAHAHIHTNTHLRTRTHTHARTYQHIQVPDEVHKHPKTSLSRLASVLSLSRFLPKFLFTSTSVASKYSGIHSQYARSVAY